MLTVQYQSGCSTLMMVTKSGGWADWPRPLSSVLAANGLPTTNLAFAVSLQGANGGGAVAIIE